MQLDVELQKLYALIVTNLGLFVRDTSDLFSLSDYIKDWKLIVQETAFFRKFKSKDGI